MGALEGSGKETSITMNQLKVISDQYFSGKHNTEEEVIPTVFRLTKKIGRITNIRHLGNAITKVHHLF